MWDGWETLGGKMTERLTNPDEFVLEDVKMVHLESMSPKHLWLSVNCEDGLLFHLNISAKGDRLQYYWSEETPDKLAQGHTKTDLDAL
jgi:hypothetical protein